MGPAFRRYGVFRHTAPPPRRRRDPGMFFGAGRTSAVFPQGASGRLPSSGSCAATYRPSHGSQGKGKRMRTIAVLFMLAGLVLAGIQVEYAVRSASEHQSFELRYSYYRNQPHPAYPSPAVWSVGELRLRAIADFAPWIFIAGCALFLAGSTRAHHLELCEILGLMTVRLSPKGEAEPQEPGPVDSPEPDVSAVVALNDMAHSSEPPPQPPPQPEAQPATSPEPEPESPAPVVPVPIAEEPEITAPPTLPVPVSAPKRKRLSTWWPNSPTGIALLCVFLTAGFFVPIAIGGGPVDGLIGAGIKYLIVIAIRYLVVVRPSRKWARVE